MMSLETSAKFEAVLRNLTESEQLDLIAYLAAKLKQQRQKRDPVSLAGFLSGKADPNFDIDAALREARGEWLKEWNGNGID